MRRKLINHEVFDKLNEESLLAIESELIEAEDTLAIALDVDDLKMHSFNESTVTYETIDRNYIHAGYHFKDNSIIFENIEELVIDEESAREKSRTLLKTMVDHILNNDLERANDAFDGYINLPTIRRNFNEGSAIGGWVEKPEGQRKKSPLKGRRQTPDVIARRVAAKKRNLPVRKSKTRQIEAMKRATKARLGSQARFHGRYKPEPMAKKIKKASPKKVNEWTVLSENVLNYIDYQEFGPIAKQSEVRYDDKGNVVALRIPNSQTRNEGKILSFNWKTLDHEVKVLRGKAWKVQENTAFCKAIAELRKANALSDNSGMETIIENITVKWPELIYLTKAELARHISTALETIGETNYDDGMCEFMAEGILRKATESYKDRINKIARIAGTEIPKDSVDVYEDFQAIIQKFYANLDESTKLEVQVFVDLYNTLVEVHKMASSEGNEILKSEANTYLKELKAILDQEVPPSLELAEEVATWLIDLVETNLETQDWNVSNSPHMTVSGDHPQMAKNAQKSYAPSSDFSGDWGDPAPVSDGKNYKGNLADQMRNNSWGNWSNDDTWPALTNPYVPKPFGDYTMKGEKGADKDGTDDWSRWQSKDTWPTLQNPYVPDAETPQSYKMNHGKESDLVVDK
jgi:hypothetical protein